MVRALVSSLIIHLVLCYSACICVVTPYENKISVQHILTPNACTYVVTNPLYTEEVKEYLTPYARTYVVTAEGYRALSPRFIAGKSAVSFCYFTPTYVVSPIGTRPSLLIRLHTL